MELAAAQHARVERIATGAARVATLSMAMSLASARRCLTLDARVAGCEARIQEASDGVGSVTAQLERLGVVVAAQSRAHRRLVESVSALQGAVGSMDERLRRVENASALRDALVDVACTLAAWRVTGTLAWAARHLLPAHAAGALVLGRRGVVLVELATRAALVAGAVSSTRGALGALGLHSGTSLPEYTRLASSAVQGAAKQLASLPMLGGSGASLSTAVGTPDPSSTSTAAVQAGATEAPAGVVWATPARGLRAPRSPGVTPDPELSAGDP